MREVPECLNRRYQKLDELIKELSSAIPHGGPSSDICCENNQVGIRLMCDFWNILKDDPDCNLTAEVQQRMGVEERLSSDVFPQRLDCYMADQDKNDDRRRNGMKNRVTHINCPLESNPPPRRYGCCGGGTEGEKIPLSKVLCNLKEAASFDKKCNVRVAELMAAQKELVDQIQTLEEREKEGVNLLKQADCMWSCMEEAYKKKVAESTDRQKALLKELKEVEASLSKWRKNKKDLDFQMGNIIKCHDEVNEKLIQKNNDIKVMDMEIEELNKRIASNVKDIEVTKNSWRSKKDASDGRMAVLAQEMVKLQKKVVAEQQVKAEKEKEGTLYIKDARDDLQKICRILLQKKLENEDLQAEKEALIQEIDLLKKTCDNCKERCTKKEQDIANEMKRLDSELGKYRAKCARCHECTDTIDIRKFCTDCPRCLAERDCIYEDDHCSPDHSMDCVCMSVKQKFLDNVFDNMYTVLERQAKTCPGKAVADCILNCLKRSRNGKLNEETRKVLQDFILSTVKKNLNLTIVGGAVKTRCEMDPETYKQLMLCLKEVNVTRPVKEDKGTGAKKEPCARWGGPSECNCPKGPKACICTKKAPPPPTDPVSCGPPDRDERDRNQRYCPRRDDLACNLDCGVTALPGEASSWRVDPCGANTCPFSNNMRAAQCVLGPEPLAAVTTNAAPIIPDLSMENMATCTCGGGKGVKPCPCRRDRRSRPRQRLIEEVMGRYTEVSPIEKVTRVARRKDPLGDLNSPRRIDAECDCSNLPMKYLLASNISENKISRFCGCSSNYVPRESRAPYLNKLHKKGHINVCRNSKSENDVSFIENVTLWSDVGSKIPQRKTLRIDSDNDIKVILCPKFPNNRDDKIEISMGTSNKQRSGSTHLILKKKSSEKVDQQLNSCDASFVGRKVCETVKELMKDIVVPEIPTAKNLSSSDVEWVTVESLFKEINSLTKLEGLSTDTVNEVEVKCETLEASKDFRLIDTNMNKVKSTAIQNNKVEEIRHRGIIKKGASTSKKIRISETIYKDEEQNNMVAEDLKSKLLDDIRQTYNISVETSLENIMSKEPESNAKDFKNIRKCLRNLGEASMRQYECSCVNAQRERQTAHKSNKKKSFPMRRKRR